MLLALSPSAEQAVATLLDLGFDPNESVVNNYGDSGWPLWFASMCGRHDIADGNAGIEDTHLIIF